MSVRPRAAPLACRPSAGFRVVLVFVLVLAGAVLASGALRAQGRLDPVRGFRSRTRVEFGINADFARQLGGLTAAPDGAPIVYELGQVRVHSEPQSRVLYTFDPPVFGSFLVMAPDEQAVLFGESSSGNIWEIALDGGGAFPVDTVSFNFDMAFAPASAPEEIAGEGFVSGLGTGLENAIWLLDGTPGDENDEIIARVPRFSGPVTFDDAGNLYLVTSGADFSADGEAGQRLVRFTSAQIAGAIGPDAAAFEDGEVLLRDLEGYFGLRWHEGLLYGTNLGFRSGAGSVESFDPSSGGAPQALASASVDGFSGSPSFLAFHGGSGFVPGKGAVGGALFVAYSDYVAVSNIDEITPALAFIRGRTNGDDTLDLADPVYLLDYLFNGGPAPQPVEAGDVNVDAVIDLSDAIYLLSYLFLGGPEPAAPFPDPGF